MNSDPNVRRSSRFIVYSSHFTAFGIECGIAFALLTWTSFAPKGHTGCIKQRNELAVAGITKVKRDKLKPGKCCLAMFESFPPPRSTHRQVF